jgi:hypothetical protein
VAARSRGFVFRVNSFGGDQRPQQSKCLRWPACQSPHLLQWIHFQRGSRSPEIYTERIVSICIRGIEHSRLHSENKTSPDERHFYDDSSLLPVPGKIPDAPLILFHMHTRHSSTLNILLLSQHHIF